ncbi:hypothetical protein B0A50_07172 [Salinomyces thailandicus]|uniref:Uncharacterized protein n=1 Tax=Salinomyces thailandicus TaxID=706561 RepID=A0A4U0TN09_9PEZI|nr:hypothetical protein B0A50_07172 [Salinomyces thailandica]
MDFGASDIVKGIELAITIYQSGFVEENSANVRYSNFQKDINDFRELLERLSLSLQRAHDRYRYRGPLISPQARDPLAEDFEQERRSIVGNFVATLTECEALLEENKGYHVEAGQRSTPLKNLQFVFTQQEQRADDLRRRLHFHTEKIRFVIDRLQLDLLTDLDAKVDDILGLAERNIHLTEGVLFEILRFRQDLVGFPLGQTLTRDLVSDDLHIASDAIAARFRRSMVVEGLSTTMTGMPLARSFDALLTHFQQSYDGGDQTPEKYLLFLKARWLLGLIKESQEYKDARPGWYFKRAVNQIDHAILTRSRRPQEMLAFDEPVLMSLPEPQFQVWLAPAEIARDQGTRRPYEQWGRRPDEREVAQIELDCGEDQSTKYARNEENLFTFKSLADLHKFQTALTGYDVSYDHDSSKVLCQFSDKAKSLDCDGRVQLWQHPITFVQTESAVEDLGVRSEGSPNSVQTGTQAHRGSFTSTLAPTVNVTRTPDGDGWEGQPLKLAVLVIYTKLRENNTDRFAVIFIELEVGVSIRPQECSCRDDYDKCSKLVLSKRDQRKMRIRICYSDANTSGQPDPNTFDIFPFQLPRNPAFGQVAEKDTK